MREHTIVEMGGELWAGLYQQGMVADRGDGLSVSIACFLVCVILLMHFKCIL